MEKGLQVSSLIQSLKEVLSSPTNLTEPIGGLWDKAGLQSGNKHSSLALMCSSKETTRIDG